jgi:hypothetical protein
MRVEEKNITHFVVAFVTIIQINFGTLFEECSGSVLFRKDFMITHQSYSYRQQDCCKQMNTKHKWSTKIFWIYVCHVQQERINKRVDTRPKWVNLRRKKNKVFWFYLKIKGLFYSWQIIIYIFACFLKKEDKTIFFSHNLKTIIYIFFVFFWDRIKT